jgi:hypothetical protein
MFIIAGSTRKARRERPLLDTYCYQCKKQTTWDWYRLTEWFTAFFIAVLPIASDHYLVCTGCKDQLQLQSDEARGVKNLQRLPADESLQLHDRLVQRLEDHQLAGKSDTQNEDLQRQRRENTGRD